jgi:hypothetical protein
MPQDLHKPAILHLPVSRYGHCTAELTWCCSLIGRCVLRRAQPTNTTDPDVLFAANGDPEDPVSATLNLGPVSEWVSRRGRVLHSSGRG